MQDEKRESGVAPDAPAHPGPGTKAQQARPKAPQAIPDDDPFAKPLRKASNRPRSTQASTGGLTLGDLAAKYIEHLEEEHSPTTVSSYARELATAVEFLGEGTLVADLLPQRVGDYFESDVVTKTRAGQEKSPLTVAKTKRVLRLALDWARAQAAAESPEQG